MGRICKNCKYHRELTTDDLAEYLYNCENEERPVVITTFVYHNETCEYFEEMMGTK